jgi:CheY-like chemotaxis protein
MASRSSILLAGMETEILRNATRSLQECGCAVVPAYNRNEAIVLASDRRFDLIVVGWSLGKGVDLLASDLFTVCPDIPILVLRSPLQSGDSILEQVEHVLGRYKRRSHVA